MRLIDNQAGIGKEMDFVYAQKIGAFVRHGNGAATRSAVVKSVAVPAQGHARKREAKIIVLSRIGLIDVRIVREIKQHGQMAIRSALGPNAPLFAAVDPSLFMVRADYTPEMEGVGLGERCKG